MYGLKANRQAHKEFNKNYAELKQGQTQLAQARVRELQVENDYLMQDSQNQEEMALLNNPKANLPNDVLDKMDAIEEA